MTVSPTASCGLRREVGRRGAAAARTEGPAAVLRAQLGHQRLVGVDDRGDHRLAVGVQLRQVPAGGPPPGADQRDARTAVLVAGGGRGDAKISSGHAAAIAGRQVARQPAEAGSGRRRSRAHLAGGLLEENHGHSDTQWVPSGTSASVADLLHMEHVKWY